MSISPHVIDNAAPPLRRFGALMPRVIVVAASTGGPQALSIFLAGLSPNLGVVPVVVVLHMPPEFGASICAEIARVSCRPTLVAQSGDTLRPGHVHFAVGPRHCKIVRLGNEAILADSDAPPLHFCKPAADILFHSAADAFGAGVLGVVLTGMGTDGLAGSAAIVDAGGSIVAQDEATSVVWGMPGAVARAGLCSAVLPIGALAGSVATRLRARAVERRR